MLRLLLLRHAKSSWRDRSLADRDRPLNDRGERDAGLIGGAMGDRRLVPDRILCSPARRTRQTLALVLEQFTVRPEVTFVDGLYEPSDPDYRPVIAAKGEDAKSLLVIGHNPTMQATALALIKHARKGPEADVAAKFPTAALAVIDFDIADWSRVERKRGELALFLRPRDLLSDGGWESDD